MSNNDKSLKKLNAQIAKLSIGRDKKERKKLLKKKDSINKVKANKSKEIIAKGKPEVFEEIKKNTNKLPDNIELKDLGSSIKVKKRKNKKNNANTKKEVKKINDNNIIVDEEITTFTDKISSEDIKELENSLRDIYEKELVTRKHPNKDFFVNDFLYNINISFDKLPANVKNNSKDKALELVIKTDDKSKSLDILSILTMFLGIVFIICILSFIGFIIWICTY